jgi:hypothetical protein
MIKNFRVALVGAAIAALAGCTGTSLPGVLPSALPSVSGGTSGQVSTGGEACSTTTSGPAGGTSAGTAELGDYNGKTLPNGWDTTYHAEADVTARITKFADDAKGGGSAATTWTSFKCLYQPAVAVWRTKTGRSD